MKGIEAIFFVFFDLRSLYPISYALGFKKILKKH
jgi:hypothetical protein